MAEILPFPERTLPAPVDVDHGDDGWPEEDAPGGIGLGLVAALAAAPSRSLAELARKVEVLVLRLLPGDGAEAGLCGAEAALLRSVAREIQRVADDAASVMRDVGFPVSAAAE